MKFGKLDNTLKQDGNSSNQESQQGYFHTISFEGDFEAYHIDGPNIQLPITAIGFIEFMGLHLHENSLRIAFPDCDISFLWTE